MRLSLTSTNLQVNFKIKVTSIPVKSFCWILKLLRISVWQELGQADRGTITVSLYICKRSVSLMRKVQNIFLIFYFFRQMIVTFNNM